ncbi:MAG TPA: YncE family protein [Ktedonobacteraceae bacterium]|nr:YncE family protein [Ktedonobacteraceae bacterium]
MSSTPSFLNDFPHRPYQRRQRIVWCALICLCLLVLSWFTFPSIGRADGGAPNLAYISGTTTGVSVIDVAARRLTRTFSIDGDPQTILLSADGSFLYVTQPQKGRVSVLDAARGTIHCSVTIPGNPSLLTLSPQGDVLYVAGNHDSHVRALNPDTCAVQQTFALPGPVYGLGVSFLGGSFPAHIGLYQLWVATTDMLTVLDTDGKSLASFAVSAGPQSICIPPGFVIYVTTRQDTVIAVNLATKTVTPPLLTGGTFGPMDYDANTGEVYVPDLTHQQVDVLTPLSSETTQKAPKEPNRVLHMDGVPVSVAITSDGQLGFVAMQNGRVAMVDVPGRQIVSTLTVGGHPHFLITGLYPPPVTTSQQSPPPQLFSWKTIIFWLCVAIFVLSLVALLVVLQLMWKQRSREG